MAAVKVKISGPQAKLRRVPSMVIAVSCEAAASPPTVTPQPWYTAADKALWTSEYVYLRFPVVGKYTLLFL